MATDQTIKNLVWIDLEMTGLNVQEHKIIQAACLVTDTELNILDEQGFSEFAHLEERDFELMNDNVREIHTQNGVIAGSQLSRKTMQDVEAELLRYIQQFVGEKESPLCGNSVGYDRKFLEFQMPAVSSYLHYRNIDISTIKQLNRIWDVVSYIKPEGEHEALADIRDSIAELKFYKQSIFDKVL